uniref:Uncharacterized protein n=1 Tax=Oryza brachyantha TaxID=4533 RepID=J3N597_ORYBR
MSSVASKVARRGCHGGERPQPAAPASTAGLRRLPPRRTRWIHQGQPISLASYMIWKGLPSFMHSSTQQASFVPHHPAPPQAGVRKLASLGKAPLLVQGGGHAVWWRLQKSATMEEAGCIILMKKTYSCQQGRFLG